MIYDSIRYNFGLPVNISFDSLSEEKHYFKKGVITEDDKEEIIQKNIILQREEKGFTLDKVWQKLINVGTAHSILNANLKEQLKEMQQDIGFEYLRFEGVFNDELEVCKGDSLEDITYNWKFVDKIFDFLLEINLKPFIVLSYMPKLLASKNKTIFYYQANYSPPKKMEAWLDLIHTFIIHLINRYGIEEVTGWYFQVWTEFGFQRFHWIGTDEDYHLFYGKTARMIKSISNDLKVGPASENFFTGFRKSRVFLEYCKEENLPLDFYNLNLYHNTVPQVDDNIDLKKFYKTSTLNNIKFNFEEKEYSLETSLKMQSIVRDYYPDSEIIITRWNVSWNAKEYVHDTVFMADFIIDNVLKLQKQVDRIGFLTLSDILSEWPIDESPFFGGRGLVNTEGIKKPAFYAFMLLSRLGREMIKQGDGYIITRNGENLQALLYNYAYLNKSYQNADRSLIDEKNRYDVFVKKEKVNFELSINDLNGKYKVTHYYLNREAGSAFDEWIRMGSPHELNSEEIKYLKFKSYPGMRVEYLDIRDSLNLSIELDVHQIELILLEKMFQPHS